MLTALQENATPTVRQAQRPAAGNDCQFARRYCTSHWVQGGLCLSLHSLVRQRKGNSLTGSLETASTRRCHEFDVPCHTTLNIDNGLTKLTMPQTNGMVERFKDGSSTSCAWIASNVPWAGKRRRTATFRRQQHLPQQGAQNQTSFRRQNDGRELRRLHSFVLFVMVRT